MAAHPRARCRRGGKTANLRSHEKVPVLVSSDRPGQSAEFVLTRAAAKQSAQVFAQTLGHDSVMYTDASAALAAAARVGHIKLHSVDTKPVKRQCGRGQIQTVES